MTTKTASDSEFQAKAPYYRTARATIGCAEFPAGAFVSVEYSHSNASHWFIIRRHEKGECQNVVAYPHHHLNSFCL